jgi:6-phosphogluconolactonase
MNKADQGDPVQFYVGSYDGNPEYTIFLCEVDPMSGEFSLIDSFAGAADPSYLALSPGKETLYCIDKRISDPELKHMTVSSFRINPDNLGLSHLNSQSSQGNGPCHVNITKDGRYLFAANYSSGHSAAFPLAKDGSIQKASSVVIGEGSGPIESRQKGPHAHMVYPGPKDEFLLVPDLGSDKVMVYKFEKETGTLFPNPNQAFLQLDPGTGPRHLVFHPSGDFVYVVNELNASVTACSFDQSSGKLTKLNTVPTVQESHEGARYPGAIRIDPDGKYVYASTRGENSTLSIFQVETDGRIFRKQVIPVTHWPRDFNIHPSGKFLLVAGEKSGRLQMFKIDSESGLLLFSESKFKLTSPGCILYLN